MRFAPRFPRPCFVPSFSPSGAPQAPVGKSGGDARDGLTPPALPTQSPANPLAVAQLLAGTEAITIAQVPGILGAPVARLLLDPSSILYNNRAVALTATKASGAPDSGKDVAVSAYIPTAKSVPMAPKPAGTEATKGSVDMMGWVLAQLTRFGLTCPRWTAMEDGARLAAVGNIFYNPTQIALDRQMAAAGAAPTHPPLPAVAEDLRDAINAACGLPPGPRISVITVPAAQPSDGVKAGWLRQVNAAGVTCAQWSSADAPAQANGARSAQRRLDIVRALLAHGLLERGGNWDDLAILRGIESACAAVGGPGGDAATSVRARLAATLECASLDRQDKLQQIAVVQRAFPELTRDPRTLYRLALARYDACHGSAEPGWNGRGWSYLMDPAASLRYYLDHGGTDVLGGDTTGMSWAQWVRQGEYMASGIPDLLDPIQGATGDCYFISALASVAWTRPDALVRNGQVVGPDRRRFNFAGASVDVSERTPCQILSGFLPIFARGNRLNDQWPAVYEKAYAAWKSGDATDRPDTTSVDNMPTARSLQSIGGLVASLSGAVSRSLMALPLLAGGTLFWHLTYFRSDDSLFDLLATYCTPNGRARVPMVAGTYASGGFVDRTGLAPSHAYSVLGFGFHRDGRKYVVLRNPWGSAVGGIPSSGFSVPVEGRWLGRLNLNHGDGGCFALAHGAFSSAFQCLYGVQ